jgi:quinol monooxygenase YgiN
MEVNLKKEIKVSEKLTVVAKIVAKKNKIEFVKSELLKLIGPTQKEKGCISYVLHQDNNEPSVFMFYENWESKELLQAHLENDHLKQYTKATDGSIASFSINKLSHIDV